MSLNESDVAMLTLLLSPERLAQLSDLTGSSRKAIEIHQDTIRLGANLMNVTAPIEISLRNAICENLSQYFASAGWLLSPPEGFRWRESESNKISSALKNARRAEYSKLSQHEKHALDSLAFPNGRPEDIRHMRRSIERRNQIQVSDGKIIAELTFYTWKRLFGPDYEHTLWRPTLKKVFPDKKVRRAEVATHLENLYQVRNRLAHHEPVLHGRFENAVAAIEFIGMRLMVERPSVETPLFRLIENDLGVLKTQALELINKLDSFRS